MPLLGQTDFEPAVAPKLSRSWMSLSTSPLQLRKRLSRAYTLIPPYPLSTKPQHRESCQTCPHETQWDWTNSPKTHVCPSPEIEPSPAATPPPPYLSLLRPKAVSLAQEEPDPRVLGQKYAQQSLFLLQSSLHEYADNPTFARQLYIHAAVYLLQGLPPASSLSETERISLSVAVPECLLLPRESGPDEESHNTNNGGTKDSHGGKKTFQHENRIPTPSLLHRAFSTAIILALMLISFLTPYLQHLMTALAYYDREYSIHIRACDFLAASSRRVWNFIASTVDPQYLIWFAAEVNAGIADGWRRGRSR
ncbi:MAG: hypothetical protein Q9169_003045 [Polycauliona sp. 2 TL-2023]